MCTTTKETTRRGSLNNSASAALSFIAVHLWRYFVISLAKVWNKVEIFNFCSRWMEIWWKATQIWDDDITNKRRSRLDSGAKKLRCHESYMCLFVNSLIPSNKIFFLPLRNKIRHCLQCKNSTWAANLLS